MSLKRRCTLEIPPPPPAGTVMPVSQPRLRPWVVPQCSHPVHSPQPGTCLLSQMSPTLHSSTSLLLPLLRLREHSCSQVCDETPGPCAFVLPVLLRQLVHFPLLWNSTTFSMNTAHPAQAGCHEMIQQVLHFSVFEWLFNSCRYTKISHLELLINKSKHDH